MSVLDKVVIVTGGAMGLGEATAKLYSKEGAKVVVSDIVDDKGQTVSDAIVRNGGDAIYIHCDVSKEDEVINLVNQTVHTYGKLDILIANAGIGQKRMPFHEMTLDYWNYIINTNLTSMFLTNKYAIIEMLKNGGGAIVNISSITSEISQWGLGAYPASKAGITTLTRSIAATYAKQGIRANAISPAYMKTALLDGRSEEEITRLTNLHPQGRMSQPEEVAELCLFLGDDEKSSFITGSNIFADGGYTSV